jgi:hypothetical protein
VVSSRHLRRSAPTAPALRKNRIGKTLRYPDRLELDRATGRFGQQLMERDIETKGRSLFFLLLQHRLDLRNE